MVVTDVQDFIAAGQFRGGEQLIDAQQVTRPGTILVYLEPLYEGGLDGVTPGSSCIANAYTSNHDLIASRNVSTTRRFVLHAVDAVGLVHALILRIQALVLPFRPSCSADTEGVCTAALRPGPGRLWLRLQSDLTLASRALLGAAIRHLVRDDEMTLGIDRHLHVVTNRVARRRRRPW